MPIVNLPAEVYRDLLASVPCPVVVHDERGRVIQANQAFADLLGYRYDEVLTLGAEQVIHPDDRATRDRDARSLIGGKVAGLATERRLLRCNGDVVRARVRKAGADSDGGRIVMVLIDDWVEDAAMIDDLRQAAFTDELTGVLNRRGIWQHLDSMPSEAYPQLLAVLDVDRLKAINDTHGHTAGDAVLRAVATALVTVVGPDGMAARRSGDEFVVIAPQREWEPQRLVDAIRARLAAARVTLPGCDVVLPAAASIGVAHLADSADYARAFATADARMYADKRSNR